MMSGLAPDATSGLTSVLVTLDDSAQIGLEVERIDDGRVVVYLPGAPNPWSGSVLVLTPDRIVRLDHPMKAVAQHAQQIGHGTNELLRKRGSAPDELTAGN